ncbi:thioredoxin family protein [bacterium]|nr:thioredoxin family protein [bacterium]
MRYKKPILYINILLIAIIAADMTIFDQTFSTSLNLLFVYGEDNISPSHLQCNTKYPHLFSSALRMAILDSMQNGEILVTDELKITQAQLDAEIRKSPQQLQEQLRNNAFFVLEKMAIEKLLAKEARVWATSKKLNTTKMKEDMLIRNYLQDLTADVTVSTDEAKQFYQSNLEMFGGASFEAIQAELKKYLLNDKKQSLVETYINDLGKHMTIKIDEAWAKSQYAKAIDNPVDKARRSGRPSLIDFGATGCRPCDLMAPILEELKKEYAEVINVEFINVRIHQILGERYGVSSIPVQVFFDKDGREVYRHVGFLPKNKILEHLGEMGVTK